MMSAFIPIKTKVLAGGKIELIAPEFMVGQSVDVFIMPSAIEIPRTSIRQVIDSLNGHRLFNTPEEVDAYLREERDSWE